MLALLKEFIEDRNVASVAPTRAENVEQICSRLNFNKLKVIVEYGPGDGAFTQYLLSRMRPDARLICFETSPLFVSLLKDRFGSDDRLVVIHADACSALTQLKRLGIEQVDCCISGIPLSFLTKPERDKFIRDCSRLLTPRGKLVIYQALTAPTNFVYLRKTLRRSFRVTDMMFLWVNIPPLYCFVAEATDRARLAITPVQH